MLADLLGQPGLRRRAAVRVRAILPGRVARTDSETRLWRYGIATLCWSALTVAFAIAMSLRDRRYAGSKAAMRAYARTLPAPGG